jgi:carotenoid 1,2-hydratase
LYKLGAGGAKRWTMTERSRRHVQRGRHRWAIGPSELHWNGQSLEIDICEWANPLPRRVCGRVLVHPHGLSQFQTNLDRHGLHRWGPIAPSARIEVDLHVPNLRWQGQAYLDSNEGDEPIDKPFLRWDWLRTAQGDGRTRVIYDTTLRDNSQRLTCVEFNAQGQATPFEAPPAHALPRSAWRVPAQARSDTPPRLVKRLEDTPFYSRSLIDLNLHNTAHSAVHESLDVQRLTSPVVQWMLPWRMPRW